NRRLLQIRGSWPASEKRSEITGEVFERRNTALVAIRLLDLFDPAEIAARGVAGLLVSHSAPRVIFDYHPEMRLKLVLQLAVEPPFTEYVEQAPPHSRSFSQSTGG